MPPTFTQEDFLVHRYICVIFTARNRKLRDRNVFSLFVYPQKGGYTLSCPGPVWGGGTLSPEAGVLLVLSGGTLCSVKVPSGRESHIGYAADNMPLAVTQEDFLVHFIKWIIV